jgi:hypothetical protein
MWLMRTCVMWKCVVRACVLSGGLAALAGCATDDGAYRMRNTLDGERLDIQNAARPRLMQPSRPRFPNARIDA